jgi:hypothetical protein
VVNPLDYDHVVVAFSGGKDSTAAFLHLLECNIPKSRIELWHHESELGSPYHPPGRLVAASAWRFYREWRAYLSPAKQISTGVQSA